MAIELVTESWARGDKVWVYRFGRRLPGVIRRIDTDPRQMPGEPPCMRYHVTLPEDGYHMAYGPGLTRRTTSISLVEAHDSPPPPRRTPVEMDLARGADGLMVTTGTRSPTRRRRESATGQLRLAW